jgi:hypothetical protein
MKFTREDKKITCELVRSHLKHAARLLRDRPGPLYLIRAERSIEDAEQLLRTSVKMLPRKSQTALIDAVYDARRKLERVALDDRDLNDSRAVAARILDGVQ